MSERTAKSNSAILGAWKEEQHLVTEGKGTRDWKPEEQKDILERGKAYDESGRAYEGHHMRNVEDFPEYQGDIQNIQFLTKAEHLAAHDGNWHNLTNWYYDPVSKTKIEFGDGPGMPRPIMELSVPVIDRETVPDEEDMPEQAEEEVFGNATISDEEVSENDAPEPVKTKPSNQPQRIEKKETPPKTVPNIHQSKRVPLINIQNIKPPGWLKKFAGFVAVILFEAGVETLMERRSEKDANSNAYSGGTTAHRVIRPVASEPLTHANDIGHEKVLQNDRVYPETHESPVEHEVSAHTQRYHTKDGVVVREKTPYKRGGKNN